MDSTEKVWGHQQKEFVILFIMLIVTSLIKLQLSLSRILNSTFLEKKIWPVSYGQKTKSCNRGMDAQSPCLWEALLLFSRQVVSDSLWPWNAAHQASLSFTISQSLLKLMSIDLVLPSNHLILCCPLLLLTPVFPGISGFSSESALYNRWPKLWSFSISPSNEFPLGLLMKR